MWVYLTGAGESPVDVEVGQPLTITGIVMAAPSDPTSIELPAGGDPRLTEAGYYLHVDFSGIAPA